MAVLSGDESKMYEKLSNELSLILKTEKMGPLELELISKVTWPMIRRMIHGKGNYSIIKLIKVLNVLGYDITFSKTKKATRAENNPILTEKLIEKRKYNEDAKRKQRKQPIRTGTRVKVKHPKSIRALSTRKSIDGSAAKGDFLRTD